MMAANRPITDEREGERGRGGEEGETKQERRREREGGGVCKS